MLNTDLGDLGKIFPSPRNLKMNLIKYSLLKLSPSRFQGIMLGNPVLERETLVNNDQVFYQWGLIDSQGLAAVRSLRDAYEDAVRREDPKAAREVCWKLRNPEGNK